MLKKKLISVHTPKASGTSIIAALRQYFGEGLEVDNSDDPANPHSARVIDPQSYFARKRKLRDHVECLHGHFHPGQFDLEGVGLFTMLRHPVDNVLSIYDFWRKSAPHGNPLHDYFISRSMSVLEFANLPAIRYLYTDRYFGGFNMGRFDLVGRYENRPYFFERLDRLFGLSIDSSIRVNVTAGREARRNDLSDPHLVQSMHKILADDIGFYEDFSS